MRVIRRAAVQGHAVPATASYPKGPFPAEVLAPPVVTHDDTDPDVLYPPGATAQNNYQGVRMFRCKLCGELVTEEQIASHQCEDVDGEG